MATNNLFNSTVRQNLNDIIYPTIGMGNFLNNWQNNPELVKKINNSPQNIGYSNEEITNRIGQGFNFGVPEIAELQNQWGIRTPKTEHELDMANEGIFNIYPTTQNKKVDKSLYLADPTAKNSDANTFINRMKNRIQTAPTHFQEAILGKPVEVLQPEGNVVDENGNITLQTGVGAAPRQGGIINDIITGARENYNQGFDTSNWGQKKNAATRVGEFLGSVARFADSAPGRGLIAGGLIGALGGNPTEMAAYGLSAGVGRQQNRLQDQLYRNQLKAQGIDTSNITGMVDKDTYKNLSDSNYKIQNLKVKQDISNAKNANEAAKMTFNALNNGMITPQEAQIELAKWGLTFTDLQKSNATRNVDISEFLAPHKANMYDNTSLIGLGKLEIAQSKEEREAAEAAAKEARRQELIEMIKELKGEESIPNVPTGGNNQFVKMYNPQTKKTYNVPKSRVNEFINAGGQLVG